MTNPKCPNCGSDQFIDGSLHGGQVTFKPDAGKSPKKNPLGPSVHGKACLECGAITLHCDPAALRYGLEEAY
jgi:hypothetical protein